MAAGDAYNTGPTSVANNATLNIQAGGSAELLLRNIYYGGAVELYMYDGTDLLKYDADTAFGARMNLAQHLKGTTYYVQVKNVSGGNIMIAADGIFTK